MNKTFHANNYHYHACVGNNGNPDIKAYALGYYETVKILLNSTLKHDTTLDAIIYPIGYSARHYIELTIKHQIKELIKVNSIINTNFSSKESSIHDISILWDELKKLCSCDPRYKELILASEEYINDFIECDDNGETFRYPFSNEKNKYLTQLYCIDIADLGRRFLELHEIFMAFEHLTNSLVEEYKQKSFIAEKSRIEIKEIAKRLPPIETWNNENFNQIKEEIKTDFSISSNQLSKIISFIKSHREFSSIINNEIKIKEISSDDLIWFLNIYSEYLANRNEFQFYPHQQKIIERICKKLKKNTIASLSQLYEIGYFELYSEEYDIGLKLKLRETKSELVRSYLLNNGVVKEKILLGLKITGQKSLIQVCESQQ
ncbi:MAG: hypothetical protein PHW83_00185 [Bacteroidales bacterium]|nr:hypothetical protein [Bacteroidales bacterium]